MFAFTARYVRECLIQQVMGYDHGLHYLMSHENIVPVIRGARDHGLGWVAVQVTT